VIPLSKLPGFDPRTAPVIGTHADAAVPSAEALTAAGLRRLLGTVPIETSPTDDAPMTEAGVLIPIVLRDTPSVLFTVRGVALSNNPGQVAFPGGKRDPGDRDIVHTALREAQEEVGIEAGEVEVIGRLAPLVSGARFKVTPVVGLLRHGPTLKIDGFEVADTFEVPLSFLMDPAQHRRHALEVEGVRREWLSLLHAGQGRERLIWGATATMLRALHTRLVASP
jgi:8-oxo-dGTP pyrophosphatase MutT (NUDIX family)